MEQTILGIIVAVISSLIGIVALLKNYESAETKRIIKESIDELTYTKPFDYTGPSVWADVMPSIQPTGAGMEIVMSGAGWENSLAHMIINQNMKVTKIAETKHMCPYCKVWSEKTDVGVCPQCGGRIT